MKIFGQLIENGNGLDKGPALSAIDTDSAAFQAA